MWKKVRMKKKGEKKALQPQIIQLLFPLNLEVKNAEILIKVLSKHILLQNRYVGKINHVSSGLSQ